MRYRLHCERIKRGLTQEQIAEIVGISRAGYNHIEVGRRDPSQKVINRLEDFFGIPQRELLAESEKTTGTDGQVLIPL